MSRNGDLVRVGVYKLSRATQEVEKVISCKMIDSLCGEKIKSICFGKLPGNEKTIPFIYTGDYLCWMSLLDKKVFFSALKDEAEDEAKVYGKYKYKFQLNSNANCFNFEPM